MTEQKSSQSSLVLANPFKWSFLGPAYWSTWLAIGFLFVLYLLPIAVSDALAKLLGNLMYHINAKRRRIARINLQLCFPGMTDDERKFIIKQNFRAQARSVLHLGRVWWASRNWLQQHIQVRGVEHVEQTLAQGKSVIIMAVHAVGLDAAVIAMTLRYSFSGPMNIIKNPLTNYFVIRSRARFGGILYSREAGLRPIIKDVKSGYLMFYLPDEDLGRERSIFAPLFGQAKATIPVLGRLAKSCNADVLPLMTCYDENRHEYIVHVLPAMKDFPHGDDLQDATQMNQAIENLVKICPVEYFWTFRLFKTRPEGEARFY
jgi:lipid A biosynthesis (KDO)2-(lauroyl)-lipid IVA acyltransferase